MKKHCSIIERASVDEAYLDITELVEKKMSSGSSQMDFSNKLTNSFVVGYCKNDSNDEGIMILHSFIYLKAQWANINIINMIIFRTKDERH